LTSYLQEIVGDTFFIGAPCILPSTKWSNYGDDLYQGLLRDYFRNFSRL